MIPTYYETKNTRQALKLIMKDLKTNKEKKRVTLLTSNPFKKPN